MGAPDHLIATAPLGKGLPESPRNRQGAVCGAVVHQNYLHCRIGLRQQGVQHGSQVFFSIVHRSYTGYQSRFVPHATPTTVFLIVHALPQSRPVTRRLTHLYRAVTPQNSSGLMYSRITSAAIFFRSRWARASALKKRRTSL